MSTNQVISIILVVVIVLIVMNIREKKKSKNVLGGEAANVAEMEEQKIEVDNNSQASPGNLDALHWANVLMDQVENEPDLRNGPLTNELNEVVNKIIAIPHDLHEDGGKSRYQLVIESGYIEAHEQVTKGVISDFLTKQTDRINEWLQWSEDQRISEGWFLREDNNLWQIGAFSTSDGYKETLTPYPDLKRACATFIKLEAEYTRNSVEADREKKRKKK